MITSFKTIKGALQAFKEAQADNGYLQIVNGNDGFYYVENFPQMIRISESIIYTWENGKVFKH